MEATCCNLLLQFVFITTHKVTVETYGHNTTQELYSRTISAIVLGATMTRSV